MSTATAGSGDDIHGPDDSVYESFDEVFGSAISQAVRRAVDRIGRDPLAAIDRTRRATGPAAAADRRLVIEDIDDDTPVPLPKGRIDSVNPYALLGLSRGVTWEQITAAYRRRARAWHPDGADPAEAERREELIRQLNIAYAELRIRRGRSLY